MLTTKDFNVGDKVLFGRGRGEKTLGTVVKVNRAKLKVRQDEARGQRRDYKVGSVWTVPPSLCQKVGTGGEVVTLTLKAGQTVAYDDFCWQKGADAPILGVVTRVGATSYEVYGGGRFRDLTPDQVQTAVRRDDAAIVSECMGVYSGLSPENLWCDGERSRSQAQAAAARLNRALRALGREAGRKITEDECYRAYDASRKRA